MSKEILFQWWVVICDIINQRTTIKIKSEWIPSMLLKLIFLVIIKHTELNTIAQTTCQNKKIKVKDLISHSRKIYFPNQCGAQLRPRLIAKLASFKISYTLLQTSLKKIYLHLTSLWCNRNLRTQGILSAKSKKNWKT